MAKMGKCSFVSLLLGGARGGYLSIKWNEKENRGFNVFSFCSYVELRLL